MQTCNFASSTSSIWIKILIISMFDLFWVSNFIKIGHVAILRPNVKFHKNRTCCNFETKSVAKYLISGQGPQFQISYIWLTNLTCSEFQILYSIVECISFLRPNFPGMRGLILVLVSNVCYLTVILIFLVVTWWLLLVTWLLLVVNARYWWLLLVTAHYCSFPLLVWAPHFA